MKLFKGKNMLDERQEQELLHIEKRGFWILYIMLAVALLVEMCLGFTWRQVAAEGICFFGISVYIVGSCIYKGIWDRKLKPDGRTNLLVSLAGGIVSATVTTVMTAVRYPVEGHRLMQAVLTFAINFVFTFMLCMVLLTFCTSIYRHRAKELEERDPEE